MTNISDLLNKIENEGKTAAGRVSAEEFTRLVRAVSENQGSVHKVTIDNVEFHPDDNGNVTLIIDKGSIEYSVQLQLESMPRETQMNSDVSVKVKVISTATEGGAVVPMTEVVRLRILTSSDGGVTYTEAGVENITANLEQYREVSLRPYLHNGLNNIRLIATSENASSLPQTFHINVVNLGLTPNTAFEVPFTQFLSFNYLVSGTIEKEIQFEFGTGLGSTFVPIFTYTDTQCTQHIGSGTNTTTGFTFEFTDSTLLETLLEAGVHTVRARLVATTDSSIRTDWIENQYMVAGDTPLVVINNVQTGLTNWTDVHFFDWSVSQPMSVVFRLTNEQNNLTYSTWQFNAETITRYSFTTQLGIELQDSSVSEFYGYMHVEDENGSALSEPIFFAFANSAAFVPTAGADLIISPANRNNSESAPDTIINNVDGGLVNATFTNFGFITDGWMNVNKDVNSIAANAEQIRALHIPSGRKLDIDYNPFSGFTSGNNTGQNVTMEIDFRTSNILDESEPIVQIGTTANDGDIWGFRMLPTKAYLATERARNIADQDTDWAEDIRTHIAVNVVYNLGGLNYVRIFVNGIIEREFNYETSDRFTASGVHIVLGNTTSDIDIFGIRVYKKALATGDVMRDYRSSLSTATEKIDFQDRNNILIDGEIDWELAKKRYNVIGHTGHLPKYGQENKGKASGVALYIGILGDADHSGTINNLDVQGQGTTAMTYYDWNQQYKITDNSVFVCDNGTTYAAGRGYALKYGEALAKKLVGKINFASSMQSHKLGLTWIFTDLFKRLVSRGNITQPTQFVQYPEARLSVLEKPFLFFHRNSVNDSWTFKYLMTFGAGKGDKPTFGFKAGVTGDMLMVEGADNDRPLALFAIPWNDDISYNPDEEAWMYNGAKQLNFGLGEVEKDGNNKEWPSNTAAISAMKSFFNFAYIHHTGLEYFNGTLAELSQSDAVSTSKLYWVTQSSGTSERYDLYRYDALTRTWVDAGITKNGSGSYAKLNIRAQYEQFCDEFGTTPLTWTAGQWDNINEAIKVARRSHFSNNASNYMHVDDALYHSCFVKFFAGTDNRAKNTYYYTDPGTLKIRFMQDDLDTVLKTNNVGQNRKPYYVEEHDRNESGEFYWQGESSGFYNLLEEAFATEMTSMMRYMLSGMADLGGTAMGFLEKYLLSTQDYFPAIAYNEQARLVYEVAAVAQDAGIYQNSAVQAITQSVGSQRWSEYQWLVDRLMYISSWCEYGEFAAATDTPNSLSWRGTSATYNFRLTPAKWLYPRVGTGASNAQPSTTSKDVGGRVRVQAGQTIEFPPITYTSDATIGIRGINYYLDIGDMNVGLSSGQGTFSFSGRKLQRITVNPNGTDANRFLASGINITNATNIKELTIRGVDTVSGALNLSRCSRLETIDLHGSTFNSVDFPASNSLTAVFLPATISNLIITQQPNLATITFDAANGNVVGGSLLKNIIVRGNTVLDTFTDIVSRAYNAGAALESVDIDNIDWTVYNSTLLEYLADIGDCRLTGIISVVGYNVVSFAIKNKFNAAWGNIDSADNLLRINYTRRIIENIKIYGAAKMGHVGQHKFNVIPDDVYGNDFADIVWTISANNYCTINSRTGVVNMTSVGTSEIAPRATIGVVMTKLDGSSISATKDVYLYDRPAKLGDMVFADGTFSDIADSAKTVVGCCFYIDKLHPEIRLMALYGNINNVGAWGLDSHNTNGVPGLSLDEEPTYSCYNTPVPDVVTSNTQGVTYDESIYRTNDGTDFRQLDPEKYPWYIIGTVTLEENLGDYKAGDTIPIGLYNTLLIIRHRNKLLQSPTFNGRGLKVPEHVLAPDGSEITSEYVVLSNLINTASGNDFLFYYPAASRCYAFRPQNLNAHETLAERFKEHNWFLPTIGELVRMYWYHSQGYEESNPDAIFAKASQNGWGRFDNNATSYGYQSSSENGVAYKWHMRFVAAGETGAKMYTGSYAAQSRKYYNQLPTRPCCMF